MIRAIRSQFRAIQTRNNHFNAPHLAKCDANYAQLTPLSPFLRTLKLFPSKPAYVYGDINRTWGDMGKRVSAFANALIKAGVKRNDVVSLMAPNIPALWEAHFAVPGAGAVLHSINTRLDPTTVAYQLTHSEAKVVIVDDELVPIVHAAKEIMAKEGTKLPMFINIKDAAYTPPAGAPRLGVTDYESFLSSGDSNFQLLPCVDEWDAISLNYTSGTTGNPKGVVCNHRGAYLNSINNIFEFNMERFAKLLSVVPMFHCNGWMFTWTLGNIAGCNYFVRQVRPDVISTLVDTHKIPYMLGAPILMTAMLAYPGKKKFDHRVQMLTGGAPPPPALIKRLRDEVGVEARTGYGLTESYGAASTHLNDPEWTSRLNLSENDILNRCTWQGQTVMVDDIRVINPDSMQPVPADGTTMGEVMIRGNIMMKGYFKNPAATKEAFEHGWFHSGDLGVMHANGRFEIKDRSKDIIISGGENIFSIQVENILLTHPGVMEAAVVAMADEKWGEVPCAFVARNPQGPQPTEAELIAWAREKMPKFQVPKKIIFGEIAKTSTGKVQKNLLRQSLQGK